MRFLSVQLNEAIRARKRLAGETVRFCAELRAITGTSISNCNSSNALLVAAAAVRHYREEADAVSGLVGAP